MNNLRRLVVVFFLFVLAQGASALLPGGSDSHASAYQPAPAQGVMIIENAGQFQPEARYLLQAGANRIWLADGELWVVRPEATPTDQSLRRNGLGIRDFPDTQKAVALRISFPGANPSAFLVPSDPQAVHFSYFPGNDPSGWHADVPVWGAVRYVDLYPGIDLVIDSQATSLADPSLPWRLESRVGADLSQVRLQIEGAQSLAYDGVSLLLGTTLGQISLPALPATIAGDSALLQRSENISDTAMAETEAGVFQISSPIKTLPHKTSRMHRKPAQTWPIAHI